jgi:hypothetical protein
MNKRGKPDHGRNIKLACPQCGYIARTTRKWLEQSGAILCPQHGPMVVEGPLPVDMIKVCPGPIPAHRAVTRVDMTAALRFLELVGVRI